MVVLHPQEGDSVVVSGDLNCLAMIVAVSHDHPFKVPSFHQYNVTIYICDFTVSFKLP